MQVVTSVGLTPSEEKARRCTVVPILGSNANMVDALVEMWACRTPEEAHAFLSNPDVTVTNMKDKEKQLAKLLSLSNEVREIVNASKGLKPDTMELDGTEDATSRVAIRVHRARAATAKARAERLSVAVAPTTSLWSHRFSLGRRSNPPPPLATCDSTVANESSL